MDKVTVDLGSSLRNFEEKTCSSFDTRELRREAGARRKRQAKAASAKTTGKTQASTNIPVAAQSNKDTEGNQSNIIEEDVSPKPPPTKKRKRAAKSSHVTAKQAAPADEDQVSDRLKRLKKPLNLNTYKNHSLGDYTEAIRRYGTTDSYSTEIVFHFNCSDLLKRY